MECDVIAGDSNEVMTGVSRYDVIVPEHTLLYYFDVIIAVIAGDRNDVITGYQK